MDDLAVGAAHHAGQRRLVLQQRACIGQAARQHRPDDQPQHQQRAERARAPAEPALGTPIVAEPGGRPAGVAADAVLEVLGGSQIGVGYDNSNVAGILGGTAAANQAAALAVTTGLEFSIDLADLGVTGDIRIMVGQNNQGHNYWANQFLGGLPAPQGNLGGDENGGFTGEGAIDMTHFAGNQFFTVQVPEPTSLALMTVGSLMLFVRARRGQN